MPVRTTTLHDGAAAAAASSTRSAESIGAVHAFSLAGAFIVSVPTPFVCDTSTRGGAAVVEKDRARRRTRDARVCVLSELCAQGVCAI